MMRGKLITAAVATAMALSLAACEDMEPDTDVDMTTPATIAPGDTGVTDTTALSDTTTTTTSG